MKNLICAILFLIGMGAMAHASCNGNFGANQVCGVISAGPPGPINSTSVPGALTIGISPITGGTNNQLLYDNSGVVGNTSALPNGTTATTQAASDNSTKVATTAQVQAAISANSTHFAAGGVSTGSANAQVISTTSPPVFSLTGDPTVSFIAGFSNTGAMTLNVVSTGIINVLKKTPTGLVALVAGDVVANQQYLATYDGAQYELQSPSQVSPSQFSTSADSLFVAIAPIAGAL